MIDTQRKLSLTALIYMNPQVPLRVEYNISFMFHDFLSDDKIVLNCRNN